jgi:hypothetical protein
VFFVPIEPDAPGWLTMMTFWPSAFSISEAVTRVTWSVIRRPTTAMS